MTPDQSRRVDPQLIEECRQGISHPYTLELFEQIVERLEAAEQRKQGSWEQRCKDAEDDVEFEHARADAAEQRLERLEAALRDCARHAPWSGTAKIARAALAKETAL